VTENRDFGALDRCDRMVLLSLSAQSSLIVEAEMSLMRLWATAPISRGVSCADQSLRF
jgi:hypothetical protein